MSINKMNHNEVSQVGGGLVQANRNEVSQVGCSLIHTMLFGITCAVAGAAIGIAHTDQEIKNGVQKLMLNYVEPAIENVCYAAYNKAIEYGQKISNYIKSF